MSKEPNTTITKDEQLLCCPKCGSVDFCITQEKAYSFVWVRCKQCDTAFDKVVPINYKRRTEHVPN